jgi:hypothetical protein
VWEEVVRGSLATKQRIFPQANCTRDALTQRWKGADAHAAQGCHLCLSPRPRPSRQTHTREKTTHTSTQAAMRKGAMHGLSAEVAAKHFQRKREHSACRAPTPTPTHGHSELHHASSRPEERNIRGFQFWRFPSLIRNYLQIARIKMTRFQIMCDIFSKFVSVTKSRDFAFVRVCRTGSSWPKMASEAGSSGPANGASSRPRSTIRPKSTSAGTGDELFAPKAEERLSAFNSPRWVLWVFGVRCDRKCVWRAWVRVVLSSTMSMASLWACGTWKTAASHALASAQQARSDR